MPDAPPIALIYIFYAPASLYFSAYAARSVILDCLYLYFAVRYCESCAL